MSLLLGGLLALCLTGLLLLLRVYAVVRTGTKRRPGAGGAVSVLVVAGSGGHTTEILRLVDSLSAAYTPRHYVLADSDRMSQEKIWSLERSRQQAASSAQVHIHRIPRSREVLQSWTSSVLSTVHALRFSLPLVFRLRPDMVLCNGPGTCVPVCVAGLLLGVLGLKKVLIVYVESVCRVQTLSLTGKILYPVSDYFFVQWSSLRDRYPGSIFLGRIV
ncbi:UDP-N-acetylglucosamine transferase subunit ALG14 [Salarias fasciatus]|uniref:UDP-N-acetylglucosamine transferase subunit ALG14 n=1 Tax=Salarias fasciatus TaxID=181472 RepID=A0A672JF21_SALFA|nr:UDP-N-acetylglucosamine transferase subunit ALG14 homolog [Salarias fasciatus]